MDYASLVHRVRELVWEHVPAGSNVAVVSKGDPALVLFDQRHGWHYPQTANGLYLGHHPDSGAAAVAHLESLRERGAQFLVIPAIYAWFLDYYTDLRSHLNRFGELIHRDDVCTIYGLARRALTTAPAGTAEERQLRDLVAAVLPHGCSIVAFGRSLAALAGTGQFRVLESPTADVPAPAGLPALAAALRNAGAQFVVVPAESSGQRHRDPVVDRLRDAWPVVLDHRHVCAVFTLPATRR
jgi:hypothetical protein